MLDFGLWTPPGFSGEGETLFVEVEGVRYTAFIRAQVRAAINEAARGFELEIAAEQGGSATAAIFAAGAEVDVFATGDLLLAGYVDQYRPSLAANGASISVSGRSKSADLIDSDVDHETSYFEGKDAQEIGSELAGSYGATFTTDQSLTKIDRFALTPGESIFRAVEKLARKEGLTLAGTPDGNIKITKPGSQRHAGGLFEGQNILVGNGDHNWSNRHSKYVIKGQSAVGRGSRRLHMVASTKDSAVKRLRTKSIIHDDDATIDDLKARVLNRRNRSAGSALKASISVQGWRDMAGAVYTPGFLIWTESPFLNIAQDMLIEAVDCAQGPQGSITLLSLVDPQAYGAAGAGGGKGNKSGSDWGQGTDDAVDETPTDDAQ